jgi:hypothetical protein
LRTAAAQWSDRGCRPEQGTGAWRKRTCSLAHAGVRRTDFLETKRSDGAMKIGISGKQSQANARSCFKTVVCGLAHGFAGAV